MLLKENKHGKLSDEQKADICNCIDCTKLSPQTLVQCVQNPIMPLRFIIRAMLVEQLNTRSSIVTAATSSHLHTTTTTMAATAMSAHRHHRSSPARPRTALSQWRIIVWQPLGGCSRRNGGIMRTRRLSLRDAQPRRHNLPRSSP